MKAIRFCFILASVFIMVACGTKSANEQVTSVTNDSVAVDSVVETKIGIKMNKNGGVYEIPCTVNGVKMNFIFDTGASDVCISLTEALFLYKNGYLEEADLGDTSYSQVADGSIVENMEINLHSIMIEDILITDVKALVVKSIDAPLLLGQSVIKRLGRIEMSGDSIYIFKQTKVAATKATGNTEAVATEIQEPKNENIKITKWDRFRAKHGHSDKYDQLINLAEKASKSELYTVAIKYCDQAIDLNPKDWRGYGMKGHCLYRMDKYQTARYNYKKVKSLNVEKENFPLYNGDTLEYRTCMIRYGWSCFKLDGKNNYSETDSDYEKALVVAEELLMDNPEDAEILYLICFIYRCRPINKDFAKAEQYAKKLLNTHKYDSKAYFSLAWIADEQGRKSDAIRYYEKCIELNPNSGTAYNNLSNLYYNIDYSYCIKLRKKAAKLGDDYAQEWLKNNHIDW